MENRVSATNSIPYNVTERLYLHVQKKHILHSNLNKCRTQESFSWTAPPSISLCFKVALLGLSISLQGWDKLILPDVTSTYSHIFQFSNAPSRHSFLHDSSFILPSFSGLRQAANGRSVTFSAIDITFERRYQLSVSHPQVLLLR